MDDELVNKVVGSRVDLSLFSRETQEQLKRLARINQRLDEVIIMAAILERRRYIENGGLIQ